MQSTRTCHGPYIPNPQLQVLAALNHAIGVRPEPLQVVDDVAGDAALRLALASGGVPKPHVVVPVSLRFEV